MWPWTCLERHFRATGLHAQRHAAGRGRPSAGFDRTLLESGPNHLNNGRARPRLGRTVPKLGQSWPTCWRAPSKLGRPHYPSPDIKGAGPDHEGPLSYASALGRTIHVKLRRATCGRRGRPEACGQPALGVTLGSGGCGSRRPTCATDGHKRVGIVYPCRAIRVKLISKLLLVVEVLFNTSRATHFFPPLANRPTTPAMPHPSARKLRCARGGRGAVATANAPRARRSSARWHKYRRARTNWRVDIFAP